MESRSAVSIDDAPNCTRVRGDPESRLEASTQRKPFCVDPLDCVMLPTRGVVVKTARGRASQGPCARVRPPEILVSWGADQADLRRSRA